MSLRFYLYISDAKVDMLLPQVDPGFGGKRESEVGISLKIFSAKHKVETPQSQRVTRLERVVRYLDDFADVGTIDEPGQYFRGRMTMRWGQLHDATHGVYFGGHTDRTVVGLGGSIGHVIGSSAAAPDAFSPSLTPGVVRSLGSLIENDTTDPLAAVHLAERHLTGPEQEVEFVAKRLAHGPSPYPELDRGRTMNVLLGSPIFVAMAD
ncbi:hypothetical protein BJY16_009268 [Actinoplanes octamycinicus]|uniref:Uncharacterized protein n=1 Tax=Actinoplanes octamycinicus TaxID=135948 RepID=A0A7W7H8B6_9ACTN|nr:SAVMC3_10250 family protein [Actinoplanes octamycinicus]MBB4745809.1 hypothetical protein [Actinoplanes octamycinicus]